MYNKIIDQYLKEHKSNYRAKYVYHSCTRLNENVFLFHYYVRERQLLQLNIYMTVQLDHEVKIAIKDNIHEQEQWALACDALEKIKTYMNRPSSISVNDVTQIIENKTGIEDLSAQDMMYILNHIMYHYGKNPDSIYQFYELFMPYLKNKKQEGKYKDVLVAIDYLLEEILNEMIWQGFNIKYIDQEYVMHSAYFVSILHILSEELHEFDLREHQLLKEIVYKIIRYWRFAFALYAPLEKLAEKYPAIMLRILNEMKLDEFKTSLDGKKLVYNILYSIVTNDEVTHRQSIIDLLKLLLSDILSFANPEDQKETGLHFLMMSGFDLLLEIFEETKDSYVYLCFPPSQIPMDFHPYIKKQLEEALTYYISGVKDSQRRMEAIDQIAKINTLLIEYFDIY